MSLQHSKLVYRQGQYSNHYYLCNYRPLHSGGDHLSRSLLRFKEALAFDLQAWIDCAVKELQQVTLPADTIILRVLRSDETNVNETGNTSLDQLGIAIAEALELNWKPGLIIKCKRTRPLKLLSAAERWKEMESAYQLSPNNLDANNVDFLVIDDIITTGATVISIIKMIKEHLPGSTLSVFTLAKSAYEPLFNASLQLEGTAYTWTGNTGWKVAEDDAEYNSYKRLTKCILSDNFSEN